MLRMEKVWDLMALGGVSLGLLATADVVTLGQLPSWRSLTILQTNAAEATELPSGTDTAAPGRDKATEPSTRSAVGGLASEAQRPAPLHATLSLTDRSTLKLHAQEEIRARLSTSADAFAYCYYADGSGMISRIFPNRFEPDAAVRGGRLELPDGAARFTLVAETPNRPEELRCMAAPRELSARLPDALKGQDLTPLPVRSLDEISGVFESLGDDVVEARLVAQVVP